MRVSSGILSGSWRDSGVHRGGQRAGTLFITWLLLSHSGKDQKSSLLQSRFRTLSAKHNRLDLNSHLRKVMNLGLMRRHVGAPSLADLRHDSVSLKCWENCFQSDSMTSFHHKWQDGCKMEMCLRMVMEGSCTPPPGTAKNNANQNKGQGIWGRLRDPAWCCLKRVKTPIMERWTSFLVWVGSVGPRQNTNKMSYPWLVGTDKHIASLHPHLQTH